MALPQVWPGTLPDNFLQQGYKEGNINNFVETKMDTGPTKRRKRQTLAYKPISGQMHLSTAQKATFQTFFTDTIAYGVLPFTMPLQGGTVDVYLDSHSTVPKSGGQWLLTMAIRAVV